jgi:uncharacterized protein with HEPN domain
MTVSGLSQADAKTRESIEREALTLLSPRTDVERLANMRAALVDIRQLTARDKNNFKADRHTQQAVAYNLAVLGEAARSLSPELR